MIHFQTAGIEMPSIDRRRVVRWLEAVAVRHGRKMGDINYIFCSDEKILEVNRQYLQHDYYTDSIAFDYTEGQRIAGDLFIGLETVESNARQLDLEFGQELHRVIVHGVLHLCGFKDKSEEDEKQMRLLEQEALQWLEEIK